MKPGRRWSGGFRYVVVVSVFLALTAGVAVVPAVRLISNSPPLPGSSPLGESERLGERIYVAEGCGYCHTQQVRPLASDTPGFGRPSVAGDYARLRPLDLWRMVPEITGTERTGPDLADVADRQSSRTWNYIHLYNPRAVVSASIMQGFPWLFRIVENPDSSAVVVSMPDGFGPASGEVVVTPAARHLVDYILSRKQPPLPGSTSSSSSSESGPAGGPSAGTASLERGAQLYAARCASCHQAGGAGVPGVFPSLVGAPAVTATDPSQHIRIVLFGLSGEAIAGKSYAAAMPSHRSMSDQQIADVVNHERASWGNHAPAVTAAQVHAIREEGPQGGSAP